MVCPESTPVVAFSSSAASELRPRRRLVVLAVQGALLAMAAPALHAQTAVFPSNEAASVRTLPVVEVKAEREQQAQHTPGATTTLTLEDLEKPGINSMADVVRYQPLVSAPGVATGASRNKSSFDRGGTTGYNIRGIEGNRIGLDIDGIELPDATTRPYVSRVGSNTFGVGRDFIDPEMFSGVDIQSGTTSSRRSAGGIGGAVGFKTKSPENYLTPTKSSYFGGKLGYDSADRSWNESVTAAGRSGALSGLIAYSRRDGHALRNNSDTIDSYPDNWHSDALLLKGGLQLSSEHKLGLSADLYRRKNNTVFDAWDSNGAAITENSRQHSDTARNTLQFSHLWTPSAGWLDQLDTRVFFQDTDTRDATDTTPLAGGSVTNNLSQNKTRTWGFSSTAEKRFDNHRVSVGVNASTQKIDRPWSVSGYMKPQPDTTNNRFGLFVEDEITFNAGGRRLALIPGLRVDRYEIKARDLDNFVSGVLTQADVEKLYGNVPTRNVVSPSLSLVYDIQPKLSAYVQYKRSGRVPTAGEIFGSWNMASNYNTGNQYALTGNRDLQDETAQSIDIGLKGQPTPGVQMSASAFYTHYKDFIAYTRSTRASAPDLFTNVPAHIGTIYQAENRDKAHIYGFEVSTRLDHGQWAPAVRGLYSTWALGYSKGSSKSRYDGDTDTDLDSVLPRKAIVGIGFDAPQKRWGAGLTGTFVKSKRAIATNRNSYANGGTAITESTTTLFTVPGYAVFDLGGYWQISKNVRLSGGIANITDKRYWDYASARNLQVSPASARDARDIELLTNPGRTYSLALSVAY